MNRIETVEDLNNFMLRIFQKQERNASGTSKMGTAPRTAPKATKEKPKSNAVIIANFRNTVKNFGRMVSGPQNSPTKRSPSSGYDPERAIKAREEKFSRVPSKDAPGSGSPKTKLREGKTYGNTSDRIQSEYDPLKIKRLREEQARKLESFANGDGPGKSKVIVPSEGYRYDPALVRRLREQRKLNEDD